ncbi:ABC transporter ATP-binding protein [Actinoalloteichus hymeniacidonis]|uniref:ABC-type multidrug transport system, ATPase component n=1 Tax=Actinoalloteichus hymeniacidonis TaxID=340345 RepID=A0AAC9N0P2_9PSEU|nr:ABC transporter ATP-binding protein [Actinoalloteichus hymeniacidonis]AOS65297.1 ABC-type multidrug transport system, ATPase component [Actinoalloteichus hymeniacidonis]MBB5906618.1 ABC-2 type transport system ATP-binding protein [Actinoalloteichus hymeniacidonis]
MTTVVEATGLSKKFRGTWALRDVDLTVPKGAVLGLVGPNGAGKTTLMNLIVDLLEPTSGELSLFGQPVKHPELRERVGYLAQDHPLYRDFTIAEMLRAGRTLNKRWDQEWAQSRVDTLGLPQRKRIRALSGGQQAQIALTVALAAKPDLLVLDEPVAAMDPLARREFMGVLMEEVAERETTVILSSHVVSELERACDHIAVLTGGSIRVAASVEELLAEHVLITCSRNEADRLGDIHQLIDRTDDEQHTTALLRVGTSGELSVGSDEQSGPAQQARPSLEELVIGYLRGKDTAVATGRGSE